MTYEDLTLEIDAGVAVVTLNRPAQRNAFSGPMAASLAAAYRACDGDDAVRAVVLTGAGAAFCVGADLTPGGATLSAARKRTSVPTRSPIPPGTCASR